MNSWSWSGPSGCGKTTTLRLIAGLEQATGGSVRLGTREVGSLPPRDRNVAMVFQQFALYPHLSVRDNLAFGLRMRKVAAGEIETRLAAAADMLEISALLDRRPDELSGGQQQRVALGRALVRQPDCFLLDEPLASLEGPRRRELRDAIHTLHRRLSTTMIYVTHDCDEALALGDRIAVMHEGTLLQCDTPEIVYQQPADIHVAALVSRHGMNFFDGRITNHDHGSTFESGALRVAVPKAMAFGDVTLGIRPEAVRLTTDPREGGFRSHD